jgi:hypothetical protein
MIYPFPLLSEQNTRMELEGFLQKTDGVIWQVGRRIRDDRCVIEQPEEALTGLEIRAFFIMAATHPQTQEDCKDRYPLGALLQRR